MEELGMEDRGRRHAVAVFNREQRKTASSRGTGPNLNFRMESHAIG
jgi:hypothetical protein